jgi:hypothetical protein
MLFGIISAHPNEHDKDIPKEYFDVPPSKLNGGSTTTSALRVSYGAIYFGVYLISAVPILVAS